MNEFEGLLTTNKMLVPVYRNVSKNKNFPHSIINNVKNLREERRKNRMHTVLNIQLCVVFRARDIRENTLIKFIKRFMEHVTLVSAAGE